MITNGMNYSRPLLLPTRTPAFPLFCPQDGRSVTLPRPCVYALSGFGISRVHPGFQNPWSGPVALPCTQQVCPHVQKQQSDGPTYHYQSRESRIFASGWQEHYPPQPRTGMLGGRQPRPGRVLRSRNRRTRHEGRAVVQLGRSKQVSCVLSLSM
jgi:hypothetical protein